MLIPGKQDINQTLKEIQIPVKLPPSLKEILLVCDFCTVLTSLSLFYRFSNLQTRSCSMVVEEAWALVAQSLPQGKLRNDTSSLPLTSNPSLLPSLPLFSFLSPNSQKSNLYPGLFPFLSVLLKTFNVTDCLSECVRVQATNTPAAEH